MTDGRAVVVVGDALCDRDVSGEVERVCADAPVPVVDATGVTVRPGGAGLAALLIATATHDRPVTLVTALGDDEAGRQVADLLTKAKVHVVDLGLDGPTPEKIRIRAAGQSLVRIDHGGRGLTPAGPLSDVARRALSEAAAVLVSDYGRGLAAALGVRQALAERLPRQPVVWDPHSRGPHPVAGIRLVTPNRAEAGLAPHDGLAEVADRARQLLTRWQVAGVAVTLGPRGALLVEAGAVPLALPAPRVVAGDPCGAGDRFAATAAACLADGALPSEAIAAAVEAASRFVGAGGATSLFSLPSTPFFSPSSPLGTTQTSDAEALMARVRKAGGTTVATGGCFDLLHPGHVSLLESARRLGDCLVVCLNSDASVARLKGPGRPLQSAPDRAAILGALRCVDAVIVFDEDTPEAVLERLRPHVFVKGADYSANSLPEAKVMARWGGQAVVVPFLAGRSTTRLVKEANHVR